MTEEKVDVTDERWWRGKDRQRWGRSRGGCQRGEPEVERPQGAVMEPLQGYFTHLQPQNEASVVRAHTCEEVVGAHPCEEVVQGSARRP